jgi:hypothetical protein
LHWEAASAFRALAALLFCILFTVAALPAAVLDCWWVNPAPFCASKYAGFAAQCVATAPKLAQILVNQAHLQTGSQPAKLAKEYLY